MAQGSYNYNKLFVASCIALVTTAMAFSIRADILKELGATFNISHEQQGLVNLMGIWGFPIAILIVGPLVNRRPGTATPGWGQLVPQFLQRVPECPSGGTYTLNNVRTRPTCSIGGDHTY